ncbi:MAG: DUF4296 domain-containing protein [Bacteroidota bacterium]
MISRKLFIGILSGFLLLACQEEADDFLAPGLMQEILKEIHYADAATERFEAKVMPRNALREDMYDQILERYDLSREEFFRSYQYYVAETFLLDSLYADMIDTFDVRIQRLEDSLSVEKARSLKLKDKQPDSTKKVVPAWQKRAK